MNDFKDDLSRELEAHISLSPERKKQILHAAIASSKHEKRRRNWQYPVVLTSFAMLTLFFISILMQGITNSVTWRFSHSNLGEITSDALIKNGEIMFHTGIYVNWLIVLLFGVSLIMLAVVMNKKTVKNPYSKTVLIAIIMLFIAVVSLGKNYLASLKSQDSIEINNLIAYLLIGEGGWSREGFAGIFSISLAVMLVFIILYPLILILESDHKWRYHVVVLVVSVGIICLVGNHVLNPPLKMSNLAIDSNGFVIVDIENKGYFPLEIKEIQLYGAVQDVKLLASPTEQLPRQSNKKMFQLNTSELEIQPTYVNGMIQHYSLLFGEVHAGELVEVYYSYLGIPLKQSFVLKE